MKITFSPPDISELEINEVAEALRSGWITTGPRTKRFEKEITEWIGTEKCVCLNSQTACAEMALRLLGIGEGDEIIVPAYTYTASASVIDHVGAKIVMIDSQKDSPEMDYNAMEAAITDRTKAVIPVDLGVYPAIMTAFLISSGEEKICSDRQTIYRKQSEGLPSVPIPRMPSGRVGTAWLSEASPIFRVSVFTPSRILQQPRAAH